MSRRRNPLPLLIGIFAGIYAINRLLRRQRLQAQSDYFRGKIVLITGASRGIGRELAREFARRGASLALAARNVEQLQAVESHFASLPDGEATPREQFFEGLLPSVQNAVDNRRILWVQTDT